MPERTIRVAAIICGLAVIVGCGGSDDDPAGSPASESPTAAATPDPVATPPADWAQIAAGEYSIWLPMRFVGGALGSSGEATLQSIAAIGGECATYADEFRTLLDGPARMLAVDSERCPGGATQGGLTNLIVIEQPRQGLSIAEFTEELTGQLEDRYVIEASATMTLGGREVGRIRINQQSEATVANGVQYAVPIDDSVWVFIFSTGTELDALLPDFERAVLTFVSSLPVE